MVNTAGGYIGKVLREQERSHHKENFYLLFLYLDEVMDMN